MFRSSRRSSSPLTLAILISLVALTARAAYPAAAPGTITLAVDATEAPQKLLHVRESIPVDAGALTLYYPEWIPGEHGPTGPLTDMAGLHLSGAGKPIAWRRDDVDMYAFHLEVPAGVKALDVRFDFMAAAAPVGFSAAASCTQQLVLLSWNQVLLYPAGSTSDALTFAASLTLPTGWKYGTALPVDGEGGGAIRFAPASLTTLVDSPVIAGVYFRRVDLAADPAQHEYIDMACDSREGLAMPDSQVACYKHLMVESFALFGARHYRDYHFLLSLSDHVAHFGLEHHESSDDRAVERMWLDNDLRIGASNLLPHELVHSWNGKYRRPTGLATPDYHEPMKGELLWVYEGLTQYLGFVLGARSGVRTAQQSEDNLASVAATLDNRPGRTWRPLEDTAIEAQRLYEASPLWQSYRRGTDFYNEGLLMWLEADVQIRQLSHGTRSLDDFCKAFHGLPSGAPKVAPYTFEDVVRTMNGVAPYDWRAFFRTHLESLSPRAPFGGIEGGGWKVAYTDSISAFMKAIGAANKTTDLEFSIGIVVQNEDAVITDVLPGSPAAKAGVVPGEKLVAVNGRHWSKEVLLDAVRATKTGAPLELLVDNNEFYRACRLDYSGGARYPRLVRDAAAPDVLSEILAAHAPAVKTGGEKK
jgi:predicted metalloprotease with PDZ domain